MAQKLTRAHRLLAKAGQNVAVADTSAFEEAPSQVKEGIKSVTAVRDGPDLVEVYDDEGRKRFIPAQIIGVVLDAGLHDVCPHCGGEHEGADPNSCPAMEKVKKAKCPYCGKVFFDTTARNDVTPTDESDPDLVKIEIAESTPIMRLTAQARAHIIAKHRTEALMLGLPDRDGQELPPEAAAARR